MGIWMVVSSVIGRRESFIEEIYYDVSKVVSVKNWPSATLLKPLFGFI